MINTDSKLLIIEDDPGVQSQLRHCFDDYYVLTAEDRTTAINELRRHEPPVVLHDIGLPADELQIEERLRVTQRDLAAKEQKAFNAELAGATAHELNQPLTAVMGYAGMLERGLEENPRLQRASGAIVRESERMAEIVRKIGKLTKYESKAYLGDTKIIDIERSIDSEPPVTGI